MKRISRLPFFVFMATMYFLAGCNKESYIESIGHVMLSSGDDAPVGYFIFTSVAAAGKCEEITIYIDDQLVGKLTDDQNGNIDCETKPVEGKIVKVVASVGSHRIKAKYGNECKPDFIANNSLQQGKCVWYYFN